MKELLQKIGRLFNCYIMKSHEFTCDTEQGIKPDPAKIVGVDWVKYYEEYTRMYCKHCPKVVKRRILQ